MSVGRIARSWIHAEGVIPQEKARERGDPSGNGQVSIYWHNLLGPDEFLGAHHDFLILGKDPSAVDPS